MGGGGSRVIGRGERKESRKRLQECAGIRYTSISAVLIKLPAVLPSKRRGTMAGPVIGAL